MGIPRRALVLVLPIAAACNALTGASDLETGTNAPDVAGVPRDAAPDAPQVEAGPPPPPVDAGPKPSYCTGITLYLPFDGSLASSAGQAPDAPPAVSYVTGRYGSALDTNASSTGLYYATTYQNRLVYSKAKGTVVMWVNPNAWILPCILAKVLFKPRLDKSSSSTTGAGPQVECFGAFGGLATLVHLADGGVVATPGIASGVVPGWNFVAATWNEQTPSLSLVVNGVTPSTTNQPWIPSESPAAFVRVGNDQSSAQASIDEVLVWDRELAADEIRAVATANASAHDVCAL